MNKRIISLSLIASMVISLTACGNKMTSEDLIDSSYGTGRAYAGASIDFEDGNLDFAMEVSALKGGDASELSVEQIGGSNVLTTNNMYGKTDVFIGFDADAILGDSISQVKTIQFDIGVTGDTFNAVSGKAYAYTGDNNVEHMLGVWSVYLESDNPKTVQFTLDEPFENGCNNFFVISKESDSASDVASGKSVIPTEIIIDNIGFFDEDGKLISADSTATIEGDSALIPRMQERMLYGRDIAMEGSYAGDGNRSSVIPGEYFDNEDSPVCVTLEYELEDGYDSYTIKPIVNNTGDSLASISYADLSVFNNNGGYTLLEDGTIQIEDSSLESIVLNLTGQTAKNICVNGGLVFEVNGVACTRAVVSDSVYLVYMDKAYVGDWEKTTSIAANLFDGADGTVNVSLDLELCPNYEDYLIAPVIEDNHMSILEPTDYVGISTDNSAMSYYLQEDGFFVIEDASIKNFSFTLTSEAARRIAKEDGLSFLVYGVSPRKARISDTTYRYNLDNSYVGDWNGTVCITEDAFKDIDGILSVDVAFSLAPDCDYYIIAPTINTTDWPRLDVSDYVDLRIIDTGIGYHLQDDGFIVIDDKSLKSISFTLTEDAVNRISENGGLVFQVYGVTPKDVIFSTCEFKCMLNANYVGDWGGTDVIPAAFYENVDRAVTFTAHISSMPDYEYCLVAAVANQSGWPKYTNFDEYIVAANPTGDGLGTDYHLQEDGFLKIENPTIDRVSETFSSQGAYKAYVDGGILYQVYGASVPYVTIIR